MFCYLFHLEYQFRAFWNIKMKLGVFKMDDSIDNALSEVIGSFIFAVCYSKKAH